MTEELIDPSKVKRIKIVDQFGRIRIQWDITNISFSVENQGKDMTVVITKDYEENR